MPRVHAADNLEIYRRVEQALKNGLLASVISLERGGLALAAAKSAMAGELGLSLDLAEVPVEGPLQADEILFSETQGRLLVTVDPERKEEFENLFTGLAVSEAGRVARDGLVTISFGEAILIETAVADMKTSYEGRFLNF